MGIFFAAEIFFVDFSTYQFHQPRVYAAFGLIFRGYMSFAAGSLRSIHFLICESAANILTNG